jgi:hypothetical protein
VKEIWYPFYRKQVGPQGRYSPVRKISPPPGFDPRTFQPAASRYVYFAIPPILHNESQLHRSNSDWILSHDNGVSSQAGVTFQMRHVNPKSLTVRNTFEMPLNRPLSTRFLHAPCNTYACYKQYILYKKEKTEKWENEKALARILRKAVRVTPFSRVIYNNYFCIKRYLNPWGSSCLHVDPGDADRTADKMLGSGSAVEAPSSREFHLHAPRACICRFNACLLFIVTVVHCLLFLCLHVNVKSVTGH